MAKTYESDFEEVFVALLEELGHDHLHGGKTAPGEPEDLRASYHESILVPVLRDALARINPHAPDAVREEAIKKITDVEFPGDPIQENRLVHQLMVDGIAIETDDAEVGSIHIRFIDFEDRLNTWQVVNQFDIVGTNPRRPDTLIFLNGLPLVVGELKGPESETGDIKGAYNQIKTYQHDVPDLFRTVAFSVISDGFTARYGTWSADFDRYMRWRTIDGSARVSETEVPAYETLAKGLLRRDVLLDMLRWFIVFEQDGAQVIKKAAGYHQFHAVRKGVEKVMEAMGTDGRGGVIWHTQGSGKSLLMAFFGGLLARDPRFGNPTLLIVTDRNDLDNQLFGTFSRCMALFGQKPLQAGDGDDLKELLDREAGGVIFTTMQKFRPPAGETDYPKLSDRSNIIIFADEAHRSQYGFDAKMSVSVGKAKSGEGHAGTDKEILSEATGVVKYGFAHYMRQALPNAVRVGFTGTPVELGDRNTPAVFGDYIDVYDIAAAVEDGATVPIYYEARIAKIELDEETQDAIKAEYEDITEDQEEDERDKTGRRWSRLEVLVGADQRLETVAEDIVQHIEKRWEAMDGKAMVVCMSRDICVRLYEQLTKLRPSWHSEDDAAGTAKVVMTGSAADPEAYQPHIRNKPKLEQLARRFRDPADDFKIVIVRDMWLTGFDAPCMHTMYIDKPMRGHGLMQAIARVNRVFKNKPGGLVVDYIGIAADLKEALAYYSPGDRRQTGIDRDEAVRILLEKLDVLRNMFDVFDIPAILAATPAQRMKSLVAAVNHVYALEAEGDAPTADEKKKGRKRFMDAVLALLKAFKLCAGAPEADTAKEEIGFYAAVRIAILKLEAGSSEGRTAEEIDKAVQQLINKAVASTEIVDVLEACGLDRPDVSVLSEEFLLDVQGMAHKNLAVEALRKLLNDEIRSRTRTNVVKQQEFSDRLAAAIAAYHNRAVDALQIIQELIAIAKDLREQPEDGLTPEEAAFYDALAENASAVDVMGNEQLRILAAELVKAIRDGSSVDWWKRHNARSRIRRDVRRLLRKFGYPPDLQDEAIKLVVKQAEAIAAEVCKAA